ncbi:hypothetical protein HIM_12340 [Hirsutella minnesotensis 3608]|uniref:Integrase catalytic domain-containing protein n=1 Tax=Hirsutella minnesotensis 3608 TaxID=1043627 RepID=A0A0F8A077_9HYPO|nr:hypothetical protein HIM_12340 [Hirsutella minnesotensis 3608]
MTTFVWGGDELVHVGDQRLEVEGIGTVEIPSISGAPLYIEGAYYVPRMPTSIFSARRGIEGGLLWNQLQDTLYLRTTGDTWFNLTDIDDQFGMASIPEASANAAKKPQRPEKGGIDQLWHRRLGHPGPEALGHLCQKVLSKRITGPTTCECTVCAQAKPKRIISRKQPLLRPREPGTVFSFDLHPAPTTAYNGQRYYALFTCTTTGMRFYYPMTAKTEVRKICTRFKTMLMTQFEIKLMCLITDGEKALLTKDHVETLEDAGIVLIISAPSTPWQNGHAERSGASHTEKARSLTLDANFPEELWPEIYRTAAYLPSPNLSNLS